MQQDFIKPSKPTDFMKKMIESDTGIQAREWIHSFLDNNIIDVDKGMCTSLVRGYLISQPSERDINGFSIAFCGPDFKLRADDENNDLLVEEQAARGEMSQDILKMLTTTKAKFPKDYNELRHFVKNYSDIISLLFSVDSIFALAVNDVETHVRINERSYTQGFIEKWYFGASFIDKVHIRSQKFLRSCSKGDTTKVNVMALNFGDMLDKIYMNEYVSLLPSWVDRARKRENENTNNNNSNNKRHNGGNNQGTGNNGGNNYSAGGHGGLQAHHLRDWEKGMRLQPQERYYRIFH